MRPVWPGRPNPRGATFDGAGVNFAVWSQVATRVEICLYDAADPDARDGSLRSSRDDRARLSRLRAGPGGRAALRPSRARPLRARARAPLQPEQAARRSVRQGDLGRGRLVAAGARLQAGRGRRRAGRPDDRPARQRPGRPEERDRRRSLRLGRRPAARDAVARDDHLRGARARLHQAASRGAGAAARQLRRPGPSRGHRPPQGAGHHRDRASARSRVRRRRLPRGSVAAELLGLQHARLLRARSSAT